MPKKPLKRLVLGSLTVFAFAWLLSACGGGGAVNPGQNPAAPLTGTASVSSSATSRVARDTINRLQNLQSLIQNNLSQPAGTRPQGRNALPFDELTGLYYDIVFSNDGARIRYFEDSSGQREAGECLYKETGNSYELMFNIERGARPVRAYVKLAETSTPERVKLRARYEDLRTGERISIDGDLIAQPVPLTTDEESEEEPGDPPDWIDEYEWWTDEEDEFFGDDYFGENPFCGDEEFFLWQDDSEFNYGEEECPTYDEFVDFEIVRFEGEMTYEGCGRTLQITNAEVDFETGQLTGDLNAAPDTGTIEYNLETGEGQILLNTVQGQVIVQCRGDVIEAIYPDGRREQVRLSQWADPCAGVQ